MGDPSSFGRYTASANIGASQQSRVSNEPMLTPSSTRNVEGSPVDPVALEAEPEGVNRVTVIDEKNY